MSNINFLGQTPGVPKSGYKDPWDRLKYLPIAVGVAAFLLLGKIASK